MYMNIICLRNYLNTLNFEICQTDLFSLDCFNPFPLISFVHPSDEALNIGVYLWFIFIQ